MISKKANDEFWKKHTVPITKGITIKLSGSDLVIEKKQNKLT